MSRLAALCAAALLLGFGRPAAADPMRPLTLPAAASAPAGSTGSANPSNAGAAAANAAAPAAPNPTAAAPLVLSAIRQDSAGHWQALIGERWLAVGDRLDGQPLTAIDSNTVRLGRGAGARTLQLLPLPQPGPALAAEAPPRRPAKTLASDTRTP